MNFQFISSTLSRQIALLALMMASGLSLAIDEDQGGEPSDAGPRGHFYLGGSTGYYKPDGWHQGANTRTAGAQVGYQLGSGKWAIELETQRNAGSPNGGSLQMNDINLVRFWGEDVRFLLEVGYTHTDFEGQNPKILVNTSTVGEHIGVGVSNFLTNRLELRGDVRLIHNFTYDYTDALGKVSLNYHFGDTHKQSAQEEHILGAASPEAQPENEALPPMGQYREAIDATASPSTSKPVVAAEEPDNQPAASKPATAQGTEAAASTLPVAPAAVTAPPAGNAGAAQLPTTPAKSVIKLVNFEYDKIDVQAKYGSQLDAAASEIKTTNAKVVVEGHTDSKGSETYNKVLSMDRAIMVKRELKDRGVEGRDIQAVGYGSEQPIASNATEEGRAQNRRVEIKLYDK